ncbi:GNAT family N-acetyltransferase [Planococcus sp. YIM B11945]|uniref:GNAT family N-acetyltransferase n=1 Tax=Planococcus sp. YIM B11945 TaxID=3435410 RepID=UPI003D7E0E9E
MEIRQLKPADAETVYKLRIEALKNNPDAFATRLEDALKKPVEATKERLSSESAVTFGAFISGKLVGNMSLSRELTPRMNHRAMIVAVYVTPTERGKGIAGLLLSALIEHAKKWNGLEQLHLTVSSHNENAKNLYRRFGFETYGVDVKAMKTPENYIDEDLMVKFL